MDLSRRAMLGSAAALALPAAGARAAARPTIKVGVLNDQSGPYRDTSGQTSVACARQAAADFGSATRPFDVDVIFADHQNKPDVGAGIARQWFDQDGVDMIVDVPNSAVALAVQSVAREKNKAYVVAGAGSDVLTSAQCSPNLVHWSYDTWLLARSTGGAMVRAGGDSWYFITANYAFGQQLQKETADLVAASGGKTLGDARYPFPETTDFSSYMVQAAASGAKVLGLCNSGGDTVNSIKQAREFGVAQQMRIAAMLMFIGDVHALTLEVAQGLVLTETFYWDLNDRTRAFTRRVLPQTPTNYPNMAHAGVYAGTLHYLKAAAAMGAPAAKADGRAAIARMKAMPTDDDCFGRNTIREDGCNLCPSHLFEVKKPSESRGPWDYYAKIAETPGPEAWRPLADGHCEFVKGA